MKDWDWKGSKRREAPFFDPLGEGSGGEVGGRAPETAGGGVLDLLVWVLLSAVSW